MGFVIEDMYMTDSGKLISHGFYAGVNPKYHDIFNVVPCVATAKVFASHEAAKEAADRLNRVGYNFLIKSVVQVCFEVNGLSTSDDGKPRPIGMQMSFEASGQNISYADFTKCVDIPGVLKHFGMTGVVNPDDVRVIAPEEYNEKYGDKENCA